jgi:hypothetical protein
MSAELDRDRILSAALDVLLPGDGLFPAASAVALATRLLSYPALAEPTIAAAARLGDTFVDAEPAVRLATIVRLEETEPALFGRFVVAAYSGYYSTLAVLEAVESATGYAARPPQPEGYALPPFDARMLAIPASRPPSYRPTPDRS